MRALMGWLSGKAEMTPAEKQLVVTTAALESAARDKASPAMVHGQPQRIRNVPWRDYPRGASPPDAKSPSSKQWTSPSAKSHRHPIGRLESYAYDSENIYLAFERPDARSERRIRMSKLYLRDACQCGTCISPTTGLKTFATCEIPTVPQLLEPDTEGLKASEDGGFEITWADDFLTRDNHVSVYPLDLLHRLVAYDGRTHFYSTPNRTLWDSATFKAHMDSHPVSYDEFMGNGPEFGQAVYDILRYGLVFIQGVPERMNAVQNIGGRLGGFRYITFPTIWHTTSDRRKRAGHVSHSNEIPCLHQDLVFCSEIPKLQILHCLHNDSQGGESLFSDGARAAWELKYGDPFSYTMLARHPVTFHHHSKNHHLTFRRPVIKTIGESQYPAEISWSPPSQGPFPLNEHGRPASEKDPAPSLLIPPKDREPTTLEAWSQASRAFKASLEAPENVLRHRLMPGECFIIDNRRILNGRTEYASTDGYRYLRGGYVDKQSLFSTLINLEAQGRLPQENDDTLNESTQAYSIMYSKLLTGDHLRARAPEAGSNF